MYMLGSKPVKDSESSALASSSKAGREITRISFQKLRSSAIGAWSLILRFAAYASRRCPKFILEIIRVRPPSVPEQRFIVEVTQSDEIVCQALGQSDQRISMRELGAVYVETNDSGPWGADLWWLLNDKSGQTKVAFPQMATGEDAVIARLERLPGFEIKGMNSTENARFLCWPPPGS